MISRSAFDQMVGPGLNKIFDEVYAQVFLGGDTIRVTKGDSSEGFIDIVFDDRYEPIISADAWLW